MLTYFLPTNGHNIRCYETVFNIMFVYRVRIYVFPCVCVCVFFSERFHHWLDEIVIKYNLNNNKSKTKI